MATTKKPKAATATKAMKVPKTIKPVTVEPTVEKFKSTEREVIPSTFAPVNNRRLTGSN